MSNAGDSAGTDDEYAAMFNGDCLGWWKLDCLGINSLESGIQKKRFFFVSI